MNNFQTIQTTSIKNSKKILLKQGIPKIKNSQIFSLNENDKNASLNKNKSIPSLYLSPVRIPKIRYKDNNYNNNNILKYTQKFLNSLLLSEKSTKKSEKELKELSYDQYNTIQERSLKHYKSIGKMRLNYISRNCNEISQEFKTEINNGKKNNENEDTLDRKTKYKESFRFRYIFWRKF